MTQPKNSSKRELDLAYVVLRHLEHAPHKRIAEELNVSDATITNYLKEAKALKWLIEEDRLPENVRRGLRIRWQQNSLLQLVKQVTGTTVLRSIVVSSMESLQEGCARRAAIDWAAGFRSFSIGVAWGYNIQLFADCCATTVRSRMTGSFVPVCGDPLRLPYALVSSSVLAQQLNDVVKSQNQLTMSGVPAFFPQGLEDAGLDKLKEAFGLNSTSSLDGLLTGIGGKALGYHNDLLIKSSGLSRREINSLTIGDLGGVLLPKPNLSGPNTAKLQGLIRRWTGLKIEDVQKIATKQVGVIVIAPGEAKLEALCSAFKNNLITHAYITSDLETALNKHLTRPLHETKLRAGTKSHPDNTSSC